MRGSLDSVPREILDLTVLNLDPEDLVRLCRTAKRYNKFICQNDRLWEKLVRRDYPKYADEYRGKEKTWNATYIRLYNIGAYLEQIESLKKLLVSGVDVFFVPSKRISKGIPVKHIRKRILDFLNLDSSSYQVNLYYDDGYKIDLDYVVEGDLKNIVSDLSEKDVEDLLVHLMENAVSLYDRNRDVFFKDREL